MLKMMLDIIVLLISIPLGIILSKVTKDEKNIYKKYFKIILPILGAIAIAFYFLEEVIALTLTFIFFMILFWNK